MARPPLLTLSDISLTFGGAPVLDSVGLVVHEGQRAALVGRNGSGKSTLLRIIAGLVTPDSGTRFVRPGAHVAYMEQDPDMSGFATLGEFAAADLEPGEHYKIDMAFEGLKLDPGTACDAASGGEKRRAALARLIAAECDLMLLDEPTNHLDIAAILWLEDFLRQTSKAFVLISHDRAFLSALTTSTIWVDRGVIRQHPKGFSGFEEWRDKTHEEEDLARHKTDRLIKAEGRWAVEGISARRKRNMGRVRRLRELRADRSAQILRPDAAKMALDAGEKSGKLVIDARAISKRFGEIKIIDDFSLRVARGDRIALVGPNGVGKTSLLKMLIGDVVPDVGMVKLGANLQMAVFDQTRSALNPDQSLWDSMTQDKDLGVSGKNDQIMVRGAPRHVVGYLKDFMFTDAQARSPVRALSGGEKARLLLARIMARESNLLVLDEPTNDLDVETLDLLQDVLADYPGTVLLVSHDRDFVDRVATMTVAMEGRGRAVVHAGGYSDYLARRVVDKPQKKQTKNPAQSKTAPEAPAETAPETNAQHRPKGLSFTEQHRLDGLPQVIAKLEAEIAKLEEFLGEEGLFQRAPAKFEKASAGLVERQEALAAAEEEWLLLAEKAEGSAP